MARTRFRLARARWIGIAVAALLVCGEMARAEQPEAAAGTPVRLDEFGEPEEPQTLRERLTEREDENRVEKPWSTEILGRRLTVSGEAEVALDFARRIALGRDATRSSQLVLEHEIEAEVFYPLGSDVYLFLQGVLGLERVVHAPEGTLRVESTFAERGETWLTLRNLGGHAVHLELGSLDFEDDRTWWWDEDLDAVRVEWERDAFDVALAVARELTPRRTEPDGIDPAHERVLRLIGEASWEWAEGHDLELYAIHQSDHSQTERIGTVVPADREDESDATLTWIGPRAVGAWAFSSRGSLGYWFDAALVRGRETLVGYEELSPDRSIAEERARRRVRGWALDAGLTWVLPARLEPRVTFGLALGSGDATPTGGADRSFRQTGIHGNASAYGGVERFGRYGVLLEPELSNLRVWTAGVGISLFRSSSLDLVFHDYRLLEPAESLRDARLELELTGARKHVGSALDLVLALEEWERFEATCVASAFRAGAALGPGQEDWSYGGFLSLRFAF